MDTLKKLILLKFKGMIVKIIKDQE